MPLLIRWPAKSESWNKVRWMTLLKLHNFGSSFCGIAAGLDTKTLCQGNRFGALFAGEKARSEIKSLLCEKRASMPMWEKVKPPPIHASRTKSAKYLYIWNPCYGTEAQPWPLLCISPRRTIRRCRSFDHAKSVLIMEMKRKAASRFKPNFCWIKLCSARRRALWL